MYGGAFDPPHNGHVGLARAAREALGLDRLVVLVSTDPGHKGVHADAETRVLLAQLAFADVAEAEIQRDEHRFTDATLDWARERYGPDLVFIIGADEWASFETWRDPAAILDKARVAVATRAGYELAAPDSPGVTSFEFDSPKISSSDVRARIARGEPIDRLVPSPVALEVQRLGLYRGSG